AFAVGFLTNAVEARQAKPPAYLSQFPSVQRVTAEIKGSDPIDTQARLSQAFLLLNEMVQELADARNVDELTKSEDDLRGQYAKAYNAHYTDAPVRGPEAPRFNQLVERYYKDPQFFDALLRRFFSPVFRAEYYRVTKKQPPAEAPGNAPMQPEGERAANAELEFPQDPTAVLSVSVAFPSQATPKPVAGMPIWLLDDSFASLLKRTHLLDGPPNLRSKVTPLRQWTAACFNASPICQQMLSEVQGHIVGASQVDSSGKAAFKAVRPGSYYVLALTMLNQQTAVWDLRTDLKTGSNVVTLTPNNNTPVDAEQALAGAKTIATFSCNVTPAVKRAGQANATLSLVGTGYTYTVTNRQTGQVVSTERGNFSKTAFYLLDDDIENIWRTAGVRPFMGMSLMDSVAFYGNLGNPELLKNTGLDGLYNFIGEGLGADEMPKALQANARSQFECAQKAFRSHILAETVTDDAAKATFASVPPGTYYLFGQYTGGRPLTWDLKIEVKPGNNILSLSPKNAGWRYGTTVSK
ncbi:MAG TPA: hypothetical protein VFV70_05115, partial [Hyphomonadaceae bacterium]|nr:hypothetical protein [Hyphomonadaceae bacterium]